LKRLLTDVDHKIEPLNPKTAPLSCGFFRLHGVLKARCKKKKFNGRGAGGEGRKLTRIPKNPRDD
jgi:hypothetical protein